MHCKVCESAKKPLSVINSHYPKNRDGFTVCPTLLSQKCKGCGKSGHTVKYCVPVAAAPVAAPKKAAVKKVTKIALVNINVLYESSDDEEQEQVLLQDVPLHANVTGRIGERGIQFSKRNEEKKVKKVKDPNAKFCWATAESDSSGSDSD